MLDPPLREIDLGAIPSPSGGGALLLHDDGDPDCVVVLMVSTSTGERRAALATFTDCTQSRFGYPNDEAYWAVECAGYGFYEVLSSGWADQVAAFNRRRFPTAAVDPGERHFFMGCHDGSGQFLASDVRLKVFDEPYRQVLARALERLVPLPPD